MQDFVTETIGHYRIQSLLARGGMAKVYLAHHIHTGKPAAIKLLHSSTVEHSKYFRFEAEILAKLSHKHILPVIEYGECESWHYLVTPYISGGTLNQRLKKGPLSCEHAGQLLDQLTQALQFAHDQGLVHCDIKPSNILIRDEYFTYLADFGLAKYVDEAIDPTLSSYILGTPEYMAPEIVEEKLTHLSDLYSLGIVLYQMITGKLPFTENDPIKVCIKHLYDSPPLPSSFNTHISEAVEHVILRALEKDPRRRFQTVRELSQAYWHALQEDRHTEMMAISQIIPVRDARKEVQTSVYKLQQSRHTSWQALQEDRHSQMIAETETHIPVLETPRVSVYKLRPRRSKSKLASTILALTVLASVPIVFGLSSQPNAKPPLASAHVQQGLLPRHVNGAISTPLPTPTPTAVFHSMTTESPQNRVSPEDNTLPPASTTSSEPANNHENQSGDGNDRNHQHQSNRNNDFPFQNNDFPFQNNNFPFQNNNFPFQNNDFPFGQGNNLSTIGNGDHGNQDDGQSRHGNRGGRHGRGDF